MVQEGQTRSELHERNIISVLGKKKNNAKLKSDIGSIEKKSHNVRAAVNRSCDKNIIPKETLNRLVNSFEGSFSVIHQVFLILV